MYQIPGLLKFPKLFHAFSEKADGNMANSILGRVYNFEQVLKNRKKFLSGINVDMEKCVCMWVTHEDGVIKPDLGSVGISMQDYTHAIKVDGLITNKKGICLFLLIADCLPIILYDPKKEAIGLVHAGWKGIDLEIVKKSVKKMNEEFGSEPSDVFAAIGPCAHEKSYVKVEPSQKNDIRWQPFLKNLDGENYSIDLVGFAVEQLKNAGVDSGSIFVSKIDTVKDNRFFSHHREMNLPVEKQGRFACVVGLKA